MLQSRTQHNICKAIIFQLKNLKKESVLLDHGKIPNPSKGDSGKDTAKEVKAEAMMPTPLLTLSLNWEFSFCL